jgi:serine/threonine protein kinase
MQYLHETCGISHRDLKPENMLLDDQGSPIFIQAISNCRISVSLPCFGIKVLRECLLRRAALRLTLHLRYMRANMMVARLISGHLELFCMYCLLETRPGQSLPPMMGNTCTSYTNTQTDLIRAHGAASQLVCWRFHMSNTAANGNTKLEPSFKVHTRRHNQKYLVLNVSNTDKVKTLCSQTACATIRKRSLKRCAAQIHNQ